MTAHCLVPQPPKREQKTLEELAMSLLPYVSLDDAHLDRLEFLMMVRDRLADDIETLKEEDY